MAITKAEFIQALRSVVSEEFAHIPTDENSIDYTFSDHFERKMKKLIERQRRSYWVLVNTTAKRVAVVFVAVLTLFTAAFSVKAIREPIVTFFTEVYSTFTHYFFKGDTTNIITYEYTITELPDGFEQTQVLKDDTSVTTVYVNELGDKIKFSQTVTNNAEHVLDNEQGVKHILTMPDRRIDIYESENVIQAVWIQDIYFLKITGYGHFDIDTIKNLVISVE